MHKNKLIISIISMLLLQGCFKESWRSAISNADPEDIYENSPFDWEKIDNISDGQGNNFVNLKKMDGDTLKVLWIVIHKQKPIIVNEYSRFFPCSGDSCVLEMNQRDTLYFYKVHASKREFIQGGYQFKYSHGELTAQESEYYLAHEDSLRKVKGNNLPKLIP